MTRPKLLFLAVFLALPLFAQPIVTSVSPSSGPVAGGTKLTIRGSGFFSDTQVFIGKTLGSNTHVLDSTTIETVTPPHLPATYDVAVGDGLRGFTTAATKFRYEGSPEPTFTRILVPVFVPPVHGAFGSEFRSSLRGSSFGGTIVYGLRPQCPGILCGYDATADPLEVRADQNFPFPEPNGTPGRFIYTLNGDLHLNLRVFDVSREAENFGTEVPIVRSSEFASTIRLHGVPNDARFRSMLRIYSDSPGLIVLMKVGTVEKTIELSRGDLFMPSYAELPLETNDSRFPFDVTLYAPAGPIGSSPLPSEGAKIWAFISVTNNTTQHITLISPD